MEDTHPDALRVFLELNHRLPPQRKFEQISGMHDTIAATYAVQERALHPEAGEREIFLRVATRLLGAELARKAYGWSPE